MKANRLAISAGLLLVLTFACSKNPSVTPPPKPLAFPSSYMIRVGKVNNQCFIDIKGLNVTLGTDVQWVSEDGETYTVDFEAGSGLPNPPRGTPFDDGSGNPKRKVTTKDLAQKAKHTGDYLYSVFDGSNKQCIDAKDPGVYVK